MNNNNEIPDHCESCQSFSKSIFCNLKSDLVDDVSKNKITNVYKKGTTLFFEGNPNYGFFEVCKGRVKVAKLTSNGNYTIIDLASEGDTIGHGGLIDQNLYSTTATTCEDSVICFFDKNYFNKKLMQEKSIVENVIKRLSTDLDNTTLKISSLSQKNVRERLAELLLELWGRYGKTDEDGHKIDLALTRDEMASMIGVAKETLIRSMSEFKEEGLINQNGKRLYLNNRDKLYEYANSTY